MNEQDLNEPIDFGSDILDIQDIIARYEKLEAIDPRDELGEREFTLLKDILDELKGQGGDKKWQDDWYPNTLIRNSYFVEYIQELCVDAG